MIRDLLRAAARARAGLTLESPSFAEHKIGSADALLAALLDREQVNGSPVL